MADIREATFGDQEAICRLLTVLFEQEAEFKPDFGAQMRGVGEILADPGKGRIFVAEDSTGVIGTVSLLFLVSTALGGKVAVLEDLIVAKNNRGQGWGKALVSQAIRYAGEHGCLRITLLTDLDNHAAQVLYRQFGFAVSSMLPMRLHL